MEQGRTAEACQKFAESLAFERRGGTLLNLGVCREIEGHRVAALGILQEARDLAVKDGRQDRVTLANEHIESVLAKLSWITVRLAPGAVVPDLHLQQDGEELSIESCGERRPVDPGPHTLVASAPGRQRFEATVIVGEAGDSQVVDVPVLPEDPPPNIEVRPATRPTPITLAAPPAAPASEGALRYRRPLGLSALGLGAASLVTGTVLGIETLRDVHASQPACHTGVCTNNVAYRQNQRAHLEARAADVTIPLGVVSAVAGIVLLVAPIPRSSRVARAAAGVPRLVPTVIAGAPGVSIGGAW